MERIAIAATLACCMCWTAATSGPATAQSSPSTSDRGNILIDYVAPKDPKYLNFDPRDPNATTDLKKEFAEIGATYRRSKDIYDRMTKRRLLEMYRDFLSPIQWPGTLRLRLTTCDKGAFFLFSDTSVNLCYDYIAGFEKIAPKAGKPSVEFIPEGISYEDAVTGSIVSTLLHETGHALFYFFQVPMLGAEEDAADQMAAFTMLQFGRELGRMMIKGALWKWRSQAQDTNHAYWDEHSSPLQRFGNFLCIAYGADQAAFKDLVGFLPKGREAGCRREYEQVRAAFEATLLPHFNQKRLPQVRAEVAKWFGIDMK